MMKIVIIILTLALYSIVQTTQAQLLDNSLFKIFRAEFIAGTVTQLKINSDSSYQIRVIEIYCSLCDHDELTKMINSNGKWEQINDTIYLGKTKKLLIIGGTIIRPLYIMGMNLDSIADDKIAKYKKRIIESKLNDFHLVYDTYLNGVAKLIVDKYRMRRNEYEIELKPDGSIKSLKYFWDNKQRKKINGA